MRAGAAAMVALLALAAGCTGGGGGSSRSTPPPSRLEVRVSLGDRGELAFGLACEVADRAACAEILAALATRDADERCAPIEDDGSRISVTGRIDGRAVNALLQRRTDCEARVHDRVMRALQE